MPPNRGGHDPKIEGRAAIARGHEPKIGIRTPRMGAATNPKIEGQASNRSRPRIQDRGKSLNHARPQPKIEGRGPNCGGRTRLRTSPNRPRPRTQDRGPPTKLRQTHKIAGRARMAVRLHGTFGRTDERGGRELRSTGAARKCPQERIKRANPASPCAPHPDGRCGPTRTLPRPVPARRPACGGAATLRPGRPAPRPLAHPGSPE
jgi:hypothetical protein